MSQGVLDECIRCARKHLRKAKVNYVESKLGHPEKWDACLGELAEAAEATCLKYPGFAAYVRDAYLGYDENPDYKINWSALFKQVDTLYDKEEVFRGNKAVESSITTR